MINKKIRKYQQKFLIIIYLLNQLEKAQINIIKTIK